jgi:hypothetical protein
VDARKVYWSSFSHPWLNKGTIYVLRVLNCLSVRRMSSFSGQVLNIIYLNYFGVRWTSLEKHLEN